MKLKAVLLAAFVATLSSCKTVPDSQSKLADATDIDEAAAYRPSSPSGFYDDDHVYFKAKADVMYRLKPNEKAEIFITLHALTEGGQTAYAFKSIPVTNRDFNAANNHALLLFTGREIDIYMNKNVKGLIKDAPVQYTVELKGQEKAISTIKLDPIELLEKTKSDKTAFARATDGYRMERSYVQVLPEYVVKWAAKSNHGEPWYKFSDPKGFDGAAVLLDPSGFLLLALPKKGAKAWATELVKKQLTIGSKYVAVAFPAQYIFQGSIKEGSDGNVQSVPAMIQSLDKKRTDGIFHSVHANAVEVATLSDQYIVLRSRYPYELNYSYRAKPSVLSSENRGELREGLLKFQGEVPQGNSQYITTDFFTIEAKALPYSPQGDLVHYGKYTGKGRFGLVTVNIDKVKRLEDNKTFVSMVIKTNYDDICRYSYIFIKHGERAQLLGRVKGTQSCTDHVIIAENEEKLVLDGIVVQRELTAERFSAHAGDSPGVFPEQIED